MESKETKDKLWYISPEELFRFLSHFFFLGEVFMFIKVPCTPWCNWANELTLDMTNAWTRVSKAMQVKKKKGNHKYYFFGFHFVHTGSRFKSFHSATLYKSTWTWQSKGEESFQLPVSHFAVGKSLD